MRRHVKNCVQADSDTVDNKGQLSVSESGQKKMAYSNKQPEECLKRGLLKDFPVSSVVKALFFHCMGLRFNPGSGN